MLTSLQALLRLATLRWLGVFVCALATLLSATSTASALEPAQTKTRVWGFDFAEHNSAGLFLAATPRTHLENRSGSAEEASGSLLAARGAARGEVGLDANALTGMFERGEPVLQAMGGRAPVVSPTAAKEFMRGAPSARSAGERAGRAAQLRTLLQEQGGRIGSAADESAAVLRQIDIDWLNMGRRPNQMMPKLQHGDHRVLHSVVQDRVPLLTRDRRLRKIMDQLGIPGAEGY